MRKLGSVDEMRQLGSQLAGQFRPGDIIVLQGSLGAGKTALTQGIGAGIGITGITSPTFVISRTHQGKLRLNHIDAYRLLGSAHGHFEFDDLDIQTEDAVTVIEWGEEVVARLSSEYLLVKISFGAEEDERVVEFHPHGQRWQGFEP